MAQLYLITPPKIDLTVFPQILNAALETGHVPVLQLRMKEDDKGLITASDDEIKRAAEIIQPICKEHHTMLIINDRPALAKEIGADGVHIGQDDGDIVETREIIGKDMALGVSCYGSSHLAMEAGEQGSDYVAFGAFYPTKTKEPKARPEPEIIKNWSETTNIACVAIGGITPENAAPLVEAGADFIAVVSYVWEHPDGADIAVRNLAEACK